MQFRSARLSAVSGKSDTFAESDSIAFLDRDSAEEGIGALHAAAMVHNNQFAELTRLFPGEQHSACLLYTSPSPRDS